ncbi:hypothetical protein [Geoglobus acetivorans]|uniref:Uncharacterized protein n=1 Tax=Geoglobus acetivorans TaxID=565033 RepID=A0ABZ3H261_GEOAI|nr:hypothetical protein [Geoglobus acetivorans]
MKNEEIFEKYLEELDNRFEELKRELKSSTEVSIGIGAMSIGFGFVIYAVGLSLQPPTPNYWLWSIMFVIVGAAYLLHGAWRFYNAEKLKKNKSPN